MHSLSALGFIALGWAAASAELIELPVPFRVDQTDVFSSMALQIEHREYPGFRYSEAMDAPMDPEVEAFFRLVGAMRSGNPDEVMALAALAPNENPDNRRKLVEAFQKHYAGRWDSLRLTDRYDHSGLSTYIWNVALPEGPYVRSFTLTGREDGFRWLQDTTQGIASTVDTLLRQIEQLRISGTAEPERPADYRFSEVLPLTGLEVLFNGTVLRWNVFSNQRPDLPLAEFYSRAMAAFKARDLEAYAAFFTPYSGDKFLKWAQAMPAEEFDAYYDSVMAGREVRFIIDADPIFILYYNTPDGVFYDTVVREGSTYRLTNFYIATFIDKLLRDRGSFIEPIIAPLAAAEDDPVAYVDAAPATPAGGVSASTGTPSGSAGTAQAAPSASPAPDEPASPSTEPQPRGLPLIWLTLLAAAAVVIAALLLKFRKSDKP